VVDHAPLLVNHGIIHDATVALYQQHLPYHRFTTFYILQRRSRIGANTHQPIPTRATLQTSGDGQSEHDGRGGRSGGMDQRPRVDPQRYVFATVFVTSSMFPIVYFIQVVHSER